MGLSGPSTTTLAARPPDRVRAGAADCGLSAAGFRTPVGSPGLRDRGVGVGGEPAGDRDAGRGGTGVVEPLGGRAGGGVLGEQQLHGVPVAELGGEGGEAAVDACSDAGVRPLPVLGVGGVDTAGAGGQAEGAAVGAEHGDLAVLGEVGAERGPEGVGVGGGLLPVQQPGEPAGPGRVGALVGRFGLLGGAVVGVGRVMGVRVAQGDDARLGDLVHPVRTDEDFGDGALGADDGGVQRLVQVELGGGDEVLELGDHRGEAGVQLTEDGVAVRVLADQDEQPAEVGGAQFAAFPADPVHGDEVAGPDEDFGADARFPQGGPDAVGDGAEGVLVAGGGRDEGAGVRVLLGVQDREDQVFELGLERLYAEPFGQRDEDVPGDLGDPGLLLGAHHGEGAHVVQPVGQFDRHDPDVVASGDEHLAEGLRLGGGAVVDLLQFGDAVDEIADLFAELLPHLIEGHLGVLDGVVEE